MKHPSLLVVAAAFGLMPLGMSTLQAQSVWPMRLNVNLTIQAQDMVHEQVGSSPVYKSTIMKVKVTNKELLSLLEVAYTNADFTGDTLAVNDNNGHFIVVDKSGNVVKDATVDGFMSNFFDTEGDNIYKGSDNHSTGSEKYTDLYSNVIHFTDSTHGNKFDFGGLEQWDYTYNGSNSKFTDAFKLTGMGTGSLDTNPDSSGPSISLFLMSGTISGKVNGVD